MKAWNKILKTGAFFLIVVLAVMCGYFIGSDRKINGGEDTGQQEEDSFDRRLAVVNMDEGIVEGEEKIYYASQLLPYCGADYTVTGLQDARNGIQFGLYSAYIVIPADFSQSVNSLNEQPAVSRLEYTIAAGLDTARREQTIREIERMAENMNDSLTKVYLSSVLQEFHNVQDAGEVIISNDQKDKELLESVNAGSLIKMVEMPEPVRVDNQVNPLDLTSAYETDAALMGELGTAYQRFLEEGQNNIEQTKEKADRVSEDMEQVYAAFETANHKLADMDLAAEVPEDEEACQRAEGKIQNAMDGYNAYLEEYNRISAETNAGYPEAVRQYEETETAYQNMLSMFMREEPDLVCRYLFFNQSAYIEELAKILEADIGRDLDIFTSQAYESWQEYLEERTESMDEDSYTIRRELIPNVEFGEQTPGNPTLSFEKVKTLNEVLTEDPDAQSASEVILEGVTELINHSKESRKALIEKAEEKKGELALFYEDTMERYRGMSAENTELNEEWNAYDLSSYIDENEVSSITASITSNHQEMGKSVSDHTGDYDKYVSDVYEATSENLTSVRESVSKAEEESERLLTEGLEEAKISRGENSERNLELLGTFAGKLPYSRIGNIENKEVYDFIAAPLMLEEKEENRKESSVSVQKISKRKEKDYPAADQKAVWYSLILLAGAVSMAAAGRQGVRAYRRRRAEEF